MGVNRSGKAEHASGELALRGCDGGIDGVASVRFAQGVDVAGLIGPDLVDELAPRVRVGLVPAGQVAADQVMHGFTLRMSYRFGWAHRAGIVRPVSITRQVMQERYLGGNRAPSGRGLRSGP